MANTDEQQAYLRKQARFLRLLADALSLAQDMAQLCREAAVEGADPSVQEIFVALDYWTRQCEERANHLNGRATVLHSKDLMGSEP